MNRRETYVEPQRLRDLKLLAVMALGILAVSVGLLMVTGLALIV